MKKKILGALLVVSSLVLSAACASSGATRTTDPYVTNPEPGWGLKNKQVETGKQEAKSEEREAKLRKS
jgi:hypothetical protein